MYSPKPRFSRLKVTAKRDDGKRTKFESVVLVLCFSTNVRYIGEKRSTEDL